MKALHIKTDNSVTEVEIPGDGEPGSLEAMQKAVGGFIEIVPVTHPQSGRDVHMVLNEEGKLIGLPVNPLATRIYMETHGPIDVINGDVLLFEGHLK